MAAIFAHSVANAANCPLHNCVGTPPVSALEYINLVPTNITLRQATGDNAFHDPHKLDSARSCPSDVGIVPENVLVDKSLTKMEYDIVSRSVCLHHIEKQPHSMFNAIIAPKVDGNVPSRRLKYKELEIRITVGEPIEKRRGTHEQVIVAQHLQLREKSNL